MELSKNSLGMRAWARFCDYCLLFFAMGVVTLFLPYFYSPFFYLFLAISVPLCWVPIEAFCLSKWGTTPGKHLFGIAISQESGDKLSFSQALKRSFFFPSRPGVLVQKNFSFKRKMVAIGLTIACFLGGFYGNVLAEWGTGIGRGIAANGWVQFESEKAGFKISFPNDPQQESKQVVIPNTGKVLDYEEITSEEKGKINYSVNHMDIPRKWKLAGNATILKYALDAVVKNSEKTELIDKEFTMHQGHRALDFTLKQGENEVKGRMIVIGNTLYKMMVSYPPSRAEEMATNPFLDSFDGS